MCVSGAVAALAAAASAASASPAAASATSAAAAPARQARHLSSTLATGTPHFPAVTKRFEQIRQLVQCGGTMYAVGRFSVIDQRGRSYRRSGAFSFRATAPFSMTRWAPRVHGEVNSITFNNGNCRDAYLGGDFTRIGRVSVRYIAEVTATGGGAVVTRFRHAANGPVDTLASYQGHILAGGEFTVINGSAAAPYLASLSARTGREDGLLRLNISGHYVYPGANSNATKVFNQQISHSGRRDLVEGVFTSAGGRRRRQIFMLNLSSRPHASVTGWTSPRFDGSRGYPPHGFYYNCTDREPFYIRSAAWSPGDRTIYLAMTGFRPWNFRRGFPLRGLCDAAVAFTASDRGARLKWINFDGCYSLYSAAADANAAYFAGHERWSQSPRGCKKTLDPNRISAPGFEGLSPATGRLIFNPTRARGIGADDMLVTSGGLWIASDNAFGSQMCAHVNGLSGICFLPYEA